MDNPPDALDQQAELITELDVGEGPGSLAFAPTRDRWIFMCTECGVPKLMPALPINEQGQNFYCSVCLEQQFFVRLDAGVNSLGTLTHFTIRS